MMSERAELGEGDAKTRGADARSEAESESSEVNPGAKSWVTVGEICVLNSMRPLNQSIRGL